MDNLLRSRESYYSHPHIKIVLRTQEKKNFLNGIDSKAFSGVLSIEEK
jgi:hypothetical protein